MSKTQLRPHTLLCPVPAVMVSSGNDLGEHNIITIAWTGTVCSDPPMLSIAVRPIRHSYRLIAESGEFVVNVPGQSMAAILDNCGQYSGRHQDKFAKHKLTAIPAAELKWAPLVGECPLNLECRVEQELLLGSHSLFLGRIVAVWADSHILNDKGQIDQRLLGPLAYAGSNYYQLGAHVGQYGFSKK